MSECEEIILIYSCSIDKKKAKGGGQGDLSSLALKVGPLQPKAVA